MTTATAAFDVIILGAGAAGLMVTAWRMGDLQLRVGGSLAGDKHPHGAPPMTAVGWPYETHKQIAP
jgi:hypothetical protein